MATLTTSNQFKNAMLNGVKAKTTSIGSFLTYNREMMKEGDTLTVKGKDGEYAYGKVVSIKKATMKTPTKVTLHPCASDGTLYTETTNSDHIITEEMLNDAGFTVS